MGGGGFVWGGGGGEWGLGEGAGGQCCPCPGGWVWIGPTGGLDHRKSMLAKGSRWDYTPLPF